MSESRAQSAPRRTIAPLLVVVAAVIFASCGISRAESSPRVSLDHTSIADDAGRADSTTIAYGLGQPGEPLGPRELDGEAGAVTVAFGGDIHFESYLATGLDEAPFDLLDPVGEMMADADIAVANLETAITERGTPSDKTYNFRAPPVAFDALRAAGIDLVSMANNHGLDFGLEGLEDSIAHAEAADFALIGIGRNAEEAYAPWSTEVNGQRIAIVAATHVLDASLTATWTATEEQPGLASAKEVEMLAGAVEEARAEHDTVIVFLHWGIERETCPVTHQIELSDRLVEAGADVIVGGHAHRLQGGGRKGNAFVHYGLGNLVFYTDSGPGTESGVLLVTVNGRTVEDYDWVPARLRSGVATRLTGDEAVAAAEQWERLRDCTDLDS